jgi:hypothetical protein
MTLLYLNISDFGVLKNTEMNFSEHTRFKYDLQTKVLSSDINSNALPEDFYSLDKNRRRIDCITAVIGKNASGKTTVARFLKTLATGHYDNYAFVAIWKTDNGGFCGIKNKMDVFISESLNISWCVSTWEGFPTVVYITNNYTSNGTLGSDGVEFTDLSTAELLHTDAGKYWNGKRDPRMAWSSNINLHEQMELRRNLRLLSRAKDANFSQNLARPKTVVMDLKNDSLNSLRENIDRGSINDEYRLIIDYFLPLTKDIKREDNISTRFLCSFVSNWLKTNWQLFSVPQLKSHFGKFLSLSENAVNVQSLTRLDKLEILLDTLYKLAHDDVDKIITNDPKMPFVSLLPCALLKSGRELYNYLIDNAENFNSQNGKLIFDIEKNLDGLYKVLELYYDSYSITGYADFSWFPSLCSGEQAQYNIYSRLLSHFDSIQSESIDKDIIVFFDEIEITAHPEYQRKLVKLVISFFETFYGASHKFKIHVIFATHSPFLSSDLPKGNVIYLDFNKERNSSATREESTGTFAGNIGAFFYENFFMEETIGEFAKINILECLAILKPESKPTESQLERIAKVFRAVGDPVLKKLLLDKITLKRGGNETD